MAYSFTEGEKRFILGEVIKTSNLDVGHLVEFLKAYQIDPDWLKMQLPSGRTMEQCIQATEHMFQGPMKVPDLKRKSMNDLLEQPPKRLAVAPPMEPPAQLPPLASAQQSPAAYGNSIPMHSILPQLQNTQLASIKPRPITTGVDSRPASNGYPSPSQPQAAPPLPRKRGRPSRADKARQLRPLLPQHLTPLAPAPAPLPPPSARDSPGTPAEGSAYSLSPGPASEAVSEAPRKKRGRPRRPMQQINQGRHRAGQHQLKLPVADLMIYLENLTTSERNCPNHRKKEPYPTLAT
ncbi:hypothetical protein CkaCkLH20_08394 [Colletotrichum karsti]|uniref:Uncharacterized protein n=1 Tax=Colletotrichum karsti TaxID=1095194 RepID=A0A9P6LIW2_9PEZI|nr:uncharacterized protein CkaCkLH20_08394 [Colletotrichum karsti]KAF9874022.1 hypothetical protein CkaCkLH20_08394 [Colletotrichum karsti]